MALLTACSDDRPRKKDRDAREERVSMIRSQYVEGRTPYEILCWARDQHSLSENHYVKVPTTAAEDPDLIEVIRVVEETEPFERGLVVYMDARDGGLYKCPYATE